MSDSFVGKDPVPAPDQNLNTSPDPAKAPAGLSPEELEAIVRRDQHAQGHIRTLEAEAAERREAEAALTARLAALEQELGNRTSLEELLAREKAGAQPDKSGEPTTPLDVDSVVNRVLQSMEQKTVAEQTKANRVAAIEAAKSVYGDNFMQSVKESATELGMTLEDVDDLAGRSPKAFAKMFGLQLKADSQHRASGHQSSVNSHAVARQQSGSITLPTGKALFGKDVFDQLAQQTKRKA